MHLLLCLCSRDTIGSASNQLVAMAVQLVDNPTCDCPRGPDDSMRRTSAETQIQENLRNE